MLDIGSWEFLIIALIALIVIGPKDLPTVVRNVSQWVRRAKDLAREFQSGLEDMAREAELDKVSDTIKSELDPHGMANTIKGDIVNAIDGDGEIRRGFRDDDEWLDDEIDGSGEAIYDDEDRPAEIGAEPEAPDLADAVEAEPDPGPASVPRRTDTGEKSKPGG